MPVVIDCASAARLIAEGAICFDTDTRIAICEGVPVPLPTGAAPRIRPILVCGSSPAATRVVAEQFERRGMAAWQVHDRDHDQGRTCLGPPSGRNSGGNRGSHDHGHCQREPP